MLKKIPIGEIAEVFNGKTPSKAEKRDEGHPILKIKDVDENSEFRGEFDSFVDDNFQNKHAKKALKTGDTLILNAAHNADYVGSKQFRVCPKTNGVIATGEWLIVRPNENIASKSYVNHWLKSDEAKFYLQGLVKGIHLYPKDVARLEIPLPPLEEQKRIAAILDKADALRRKREKAIALTDDLLRSTFLDMFGDPVTNPKGFNECFLKSLYINEKNGTKCGPFGSALKKHEYLDSGIPVWNMDNISKSGEFVPPANLWISEKKFKELESYGVVNGDIIISRAGTVGKMCVVQSEYDKSIISTNLIRLRLSKNLSPIFFVSLMSFCRGRVGRLKTGPDGAFTHMNTGILDNLKIPLPPKELQDEYEKVYRKRNQRICTHKNFLEKADLFFSSISKRAFRGELTSQKEVA